MGLCFHLCHSPGPISKQILTRSKWVLHHIFHILSPHRNSENRQTSVEVHFGNITICLVVAVECMIFMACRMAIVISEKKLKANVSRTECYYCLESKFSHENATDTAKKNLFNFTWTNRQQEIKSIRCVWASVRRVYEAAKYIVYNLTCKHISNEHFFCTWFDIKMQH